MTWSTNTKITVAVVITGLAVTAIALGKFGEKAKVLTKGAETVVNTVAKPIEKATGKA